MLISNTFQKIKIINRWCLATSSLDCGRKYKSALRAPKYMEVLFGIWRSEYELMIHQHWKVPVLCNLILTRSMWLMIYFTFKNKQKIVIKSKVLIGILLSTFGVSHNTVSWATYKNSRQHTFTAVWSRPKFVHFLCTHQHILLLQLFDDCSLQDTNFSDDAHTHVSVSFSRSKNIPHSSNW